MQEAIPTEQYLLPGGDFSIRHHLGVIRGRAWTILACVVVVFSLAAVRAFRATPIYEASARLLIERRLPQVGPFEQTPERRDSEYFATQVNLITSKAVLQKALERERLAGLFQSDEPRASARPGLWHSIVREVKATLGEEPTRTREPWEALRDMLQVRPVSDTDLVDIKVRGPDPRLCPLLANAVANAYVEYSVAMRQQSAGQAFTMLQKQMREQESALTQAEDSLLSYLEQSTIPELGSPGQESPVMERRKALNEEYTRVQLRRIEMAVAIEGIDQARQSGDDLNALLSIGLIANAPAVSSLYNDLVQTQLQTKTLLRSFGEKHPDVVAMMDKAAQLRVELKQAIDRVADSIRAEHDMLLAREEELTRALAQENQSALEQVRKSSAYDRLERDVARQARVFDVIVDRMKEVDLTKDVGITNVSLVEAAVVPQTPVSPNKPRALFLGAFLGVLLGLATAYGLEHLDDTVKTPDDVESRLRLPWLGYVPRLRSAPGERNGFVGIAQHALTYPSSTGTEAFRAIRTNVYFSGESGRMKSLMVTSVAPQDGKSIFACNLAATVALDGKRVLLVDADLRRPTIHKAFQVRRSPGLTNLLVEGIPLSQLVQRQADPSLGGLHILSAGARTPNPSELLGAPTMARFVAQARQQYDMVIFDCCPALFVADAAGLASSCDGIVLVMKAAKTRRNAADLARKQLEALNGNVIGAVLNHVRPRALRAYGSGGYYYYEYHRYYKDYGDGEDEDELLTLSPPVGQEVAPAAAEPAGTAAVAERSDTVSFFVAGDDGSSRTFFLDEGEEVVLGRADGVGRLVLHGTHVSRTHCRLSVADGAVRVEDLGSSNGTYLNGRRIMAAQAERGDVIRVGSFEVFVGAAGEEGRA